MVAKPPAVSPRPEHGRKKKKEEVVVVEDPSLATGANFSQVLQICFVQFIVIRIVVHGTVDVLLVDLEGPYYITRCERDYFKFVMLLKL